MASRKISLFGTLLMLIYSVSTANNLPKSTPSSKVSYEHREFHKQYMEADSSCFYIDIYYPYIVSGLSLAAKDSVNKNVKRMLINGPPYEPYDPEDSTSRQGNLMSFDEMASHLFNDFSEELKFRKQEGLSPTAWFSDDSAWVAGDTCGILSIADEWVSYLGGAHGNDRRCFLNFDIYSGRQVNLRDILKKDCEGKLRKIVHKRFRQIREVPSDQEFIDSSFWIDGSSFPITKNCSIGNNGITFYYNPYEILSGADGPTELLVTYDEIKDLIDEKGLLRRPSR